jgi:hypothetical protein
MIKSLTKTHHQVIQVMTSPPSLMRRKELVTIDWWKQVKLSIDDTGDKIYKPRQLEVNKDACLRLLCEGGHKCAAQYSWVQRQDVVAQRTCDEGYDFNNH